MADPYRLYIVRHLKTDANKKRQYCGWTDSSVADEARYSVLGEMPVVVSEVYGSDLIRTRQTAGIYFPEARFIEDARFRECHFGDFEGKTYDQLQHDRDYRDWLDNPWETSPRGGETLQQVKERMLGALHELPNNATVVTHSGVIRLLLDTFADPKRDFWEWKVPNGSVWQFEWADEQQWKEGKRCTSISEVPIMAKQNL